MTASAIPYFPDDAHSRTETRNNDSLFGARARQTSVARDVTEQSLSDEALFLKIQAKDMDALGLIYERYARLVFSICARIIKDSGEAQDLVHEVFLCLYRQAALFDPNKGTARSWLLQIAYHRCFDWKKHLKSRHGFGQPDGASRGIGFARESAVPDFAGQILWNPRMVAAFNQLTSEQQTSLRMYYLDGLTFQEIAEQLGCAKGNVKNHVYRGLAHLREILFQPAKANGLASQPNRTDSQFVKWITAQEHSR